MAALHLTGVCHVWLVSIVMAHELPVWLRIVYEVPEVPGMQPVPPAIFDVYPKSMPDQHFRIRGQSITIPCKARGYLLPPYLPDIQYNWTDIKNKTALGDRFTTAKFNALQISNMQLSDTSVYTCTISSAAVNYTRSWSHTVYVYTYPMFVREYRFFYLMMRCDKARIEKKRLEIEDYWCHDALIDNRKCKYKASAPDCLHSFTEMTDILPNSEMRIILVQKAVYFDNPGEMDQMVYRDRVKDHLEKTGDALISEFDAQQRKFENLEHGVLFQHYKTIKKIQPVCPEGYEVFRFYTCVPCNIGYYRTIELGICMACPYWRYQDEMGQEVCKKCPKLHLSYHLGAKSKSECLTLTRTWQFQAACSALTLFIISALMCTYRCCPRAFSLCGIKETVERRELIDDDFDDYMFLEERDKIDLKYT